MMIFRLFADNKYSLEELKKYNPEFILYSLKLLVFEYNPMIERVLRPMFEQAIVYKESKESKAMPYSMEIKMTFDRNDPLLSQKINTALKTAIKNLDEQIQT